MSQRLTQSADYWSTQFQVTPEAIEALYNSIIEAGDPMSIETVSLFFVQHVIDEEAHKIRAESSKSKTYMPDQEYTVGEKLVFPSFNYAIGTVSGTREGYNPDDGDFTILDVIFEDNGGLSAQFAAGLQTLHALLAVEEGNEAEDSVSVVEKIYEQFHNLIRPKIEKALANNDKFVSFGQIWFLSDLLVEVQEGLLNIVDAAIDINGGPLNVDALIEQIELHGGDKITEALRFSVNYCLNADDRFVNVGSDHIVLWYLDRLMPDWVKQTPSRLRRKDLSFNINLLDNEQRALLMEIDDEATPAEFAKPVDPTANSVTFVLNYHHRRLGTLPVLPSVRQLLPFANDRPMAVTLIDGRSGDEMLCWYISEYDFIMGLENWYAQYKLPVGVVINLTKTDNPLRLAVDYIPQRAQQEHVKVAIAKEGKLSFEIRKRRLSCKFDDLMIIGEEGSDSIDALWSKLEKEGQTISDLLLYILPELMRFTSQGTVHIKTIYSAVNVLKRCSPGLLMQELISHDSFESKGHGYWTYSPTR